MSIEQKKVDTQKNKQDSATVPFHSIQNISHPFVQMQIARHADTFFFLFPISFGYR